MDPFTADNRASNTVKKTNSDLNTWYRRCKSVKEFRKVDHISINELDSLLCHFFIKVRKYGQERTVITNVSQAALATFKRVFTDTLHRLEERTARGGDSTVKNTGGAGSIVWGLRFWLEKIFWGSSKILIWTIVRG